MNTLEDTLVAALTETAAEIPADHLPPLQLPLPSQSSPVVQASLSSHFVVGSANGLEQMPVAASQVPTV